jgi:hypothetical protein
MKNQRRIRTFRIKISVPYLGKRRSFGEQSQHRVREVKYREVIETRGYREKIRHENKQ